MRFSVVIPTFRRRDRVLHNVAALAGQTERDFEVIVVDDGSGDGTPGALRELQVPFPLTVIEQENLGAGAARNAGVARASGELLLFLDDDMEADPRMLAQHDRSHRDGADVVLGDLPLHPSSPSNLLSAGVGLWARTRRERLTAPGAEIGLGELLTGQISISREDYDRVGEFDPSFTREGLFGGEDIDFGFRVLKAGLRVVFNPAAISRQYYDVAPSDYLRRAREAGRSDQELILKHPELAQRLPAGPAFHTRRSRWVLGPLVAAPEALSAPLRWGAGAVVRSGRDGPLARRLFFAVRTLEHLRGARSVRRRKGGRRALVLAYHAVSDLSADPVLAEYGIPAPVLAEQLDALARRRHCFVGLDRVLDAVDGGTALPPRALLVTFDDAYADFLEAGLPVLSERGIPSVVFAVSGHTGGSNEWDRHLGARPLPLLGPEQLREVAGQGVEIGAHGVTHRPLTGLTQEEVAAELRDSADQLGAMGLPRPRAFAYPHGAWNEGCAREAREAGYAAAFTIEPGVLREGLDPHALPRIEVMAADTPRRLRVKLATAGWPPLARRVLLRLLRGRR
jgi:GT2 family glycosyltransferase/peptidoglycan/xylan/chitin deacetylase (PgdA/CDA1 family)